MRIDIAQAIAVTSELVGTNLSEAAARVMLDDLALYPENQVLGALTRCRRELKGRLTPADVISRLDDGRPGAEEAWALAPKDEATTAVWTREMSEAMGTVRDLINAGDMIAARMTFKECYAKLVQEARDMRRPVEWDASLGWDKAGRAPAIRQAVERGRLSLGEATSLLPDLGEELTKPLSLIANSSIAELPAPDVSDETRERRRAALSTFVRGFGKRVPSAKPDQRDRACLSDSGESEIQPPLPSTGETQAGASA